MLGSGSRLQLIDVREPWERALGSIEPSSHVPLGRLEAGAPEISALDPQVPTVAYCAVGARSLRAAKVLRQRHGFRSVVSLRGGMKGWSP